MNYHTLNGLIKINKSHDHLLFRLQIYKLSGHNRIKLVCVLKTGRHGFKEKDNKVFRLLFHIVKEEKLESSDK